MPDPTSLNIRFIRPDGLEAIVFADPGKSVLLGRDLSCDVRLDGRKVSRRHLRIENRPDGAVMLVDNGSHNGTFVNGQRVNEVMLVDGDTVQCGEWEGKVELRLVRASEPQRAPGMMPAFETPALPVRQLPIRPSSDTGTGTAKATRAQNTASDSDPDDVFEGVTDPQGKGTPASVPIGQGPRVTTKPKMTPPVTTRVFQIPENWNWEDTPQAAEALRTARVDDNPLVRRLTESQVNLDFKGLQELSREITDDKTGGFRPSSPQALDGIALRLVFKVTEALANADSMDQFLAEMCESLQGAARAKAVIVLLPDDTGHLVPRAVKLRRVEEKVQLSRTVIEHAIRNRAALTTEDASADERFARGESVLRFDLKAVLCAPLVRSGEVIGALYLTRDLPFSNTERDLVAALAQLIAMGLERARLREQYAAAERTRRSLERFHAPRVVERLMMEHNAPIGARGDGLFLEPLTATILFCDLAGFTKWCEAHDSETVGLVLNQYLGAMTETVFKYGGTVDKFIGDAIMCIFGAPFMSPDDPIRAVRCAIEMRLGFRELVASGACGEAARGLDVHIGVNTGKVVAGTVGSQQRMEYTALGDTVNIASRLEGVAKAGMIVVGPTTAALVRDQIPLRSLGPVALKGKSDTLEAFEVPDTGR
ncbi:MAG: FHA domain-containing protein [Deltaproteobacteria bacterium]|nr:FHA domain-containing protein [Deltaproteobacteria bacterium]